MMGYGETLIAAFEVAVRTGVGYDEAKKKLEDYVWELERENGPESVTF